MNQYLTLLTTPPDILETQMWEMRASNFAPWDQSLQIFSTPNLRRKSGLSLANGAPVLKAASCTKNTISEYIIRVGELSPLPLDCNSMQKNTHREAMGMILLLIFSLEPPVVGLQPFQYGQESWHIRERTVKFDIEENCPIGTDLGTVAEVPFPAEKSTVQAASQNRELTYKFGSPSELFSVGLSNGRLTTRAAIDAEALCNQARGQEIRRSMADKKMADQKFTDTADDTKSGLISITSRSTSRIDCSANGELTAILDINAFTPDGSLIAVHRAMIRIHDLNDNWPEFEQSHWYRELKEALYRKGRKLELPKAKDADLLGEHNRIRYRLEAVNESIDELPFQLETSPSGQPMLVLTEDLDAERKTQYQFYLVAYSPAAMWSPESAASDPVSSVLDDGRRGNHSRLRVEIKVADMNDNDPYFDAASYNVSVPEDTPAGMPIYRMVAHDADSTAHLTYSLGPSEENKLISSMFQIEKDGRVKLISQLDYEQRNTYQIPVEVNDGEFYRRTILTVLVEDVNDEPPRFELTPKELVVEGNAQEGTLIGRVRISDPDGPLVNGQVRCHEPEDLLHKQILSFLPDPVLSPASSTYDLTIRKTLEPEKSALNSGAESCKSYLICSDGNKLLDVSSARHTVTMTATLVIRQQNMYTPTFSRSIYHASLYENNAVGEKILKVDATDKDDDENAEITYSISDAINFEVDSSSGWIVAKRSFDREGRENYLVIVQATDSGRPSRSSTALLNVTILDTNDNRPVLLPSEFSADYQYERDKALLGRIGDTNIFVVEENSPPNTHLGDVLAKDNDASRNAELRFSLVKESETLYGSRFRLRENGSLSTAIELDREDKDYYELQVQVSDKSETEPLSSTGIIRIVVRDINDNAPKFVQPNGLFSPDLFSVKTVKIRNHGIQQSTVISLEKWKHLKLEPTVRLSVFEESGFKVVKLLATDVDAGDNGRVLYRLDELPTTTKKYPIQIRKRPFLQIISEEGVVVLKRSLMTDDVGIHFFQVTALDCGSVVSQAVKKILVVEITNAFSAKGGSTAMASSYTSINATAIRLGMNSIADRNTILIIAILVGVSALLMLATTIVIICVVRPWMRTRQTEDESRPQKCAGSSVKVESVFGDEPVSDQTVNVSLLYGYSSNSGEPSRYDLAVEGKQALAINDFQPTQEGGNIAETATEHPNILATNMPPSQQTAGHRNEYFVSPDPQLMIHDAGVNNNGGTVRLLGRLRGSQSMGVGSVGLSSFAYRYQMAQTDSLRRKALKTTFASQASYFASNPTTRIFRSDSGHFESEEGSRIYIQDTGGRGSQWVAR
ncbi:unnamed protein product [Calicophoron daubneyi]|uniref:Cadherin domain-containing protein n=1 Tax=Calicophoron daubneyi TaxID=300641 RepID=A0AAV2TV45_CALDB